MIANSSNKQPDPLQALDMPSSAPKPPFERASKGPRCEVLLLQSAASALTKFEQTRENLQTRPCSSAYI